MADNTIHAYSRLLQIRRGIAQGLANNRAQRIVISGYYGYGNSGDEALLESILLALREESTKLGIDIVPIVLSIRPQATEMMHGVKAIHRMNVFQIAKELRNADGLISGGGSLLQDATGTMTIPYYLIMIKIAQWLSKPTFIYSQGVGPITKRIFYPLIKHVYSRAQYMSVRDEPSANLLREIGLPQERIQLVSDPVMGLPLTPAEERSTHARRPIESEVEASDMPIIGVSVRFWEQKREDLNGIAGALAHLLKTRSVRIRLLPFHIPNDIKASNHILARLEQMCSKGEMANIELVLDAVQPQDMLREIQACNILIGMRLHSLIYAAANRIPMLGISYDPKIDHFLEQIGVPVAAHSHNVDPEQLAEQAFNLLQTGKDMMESRAEQIDQLRQTANIPAQQIADILRVSSIIKAERNRMETINLYGIEVSRRTLQQTADKLQQAIADKQKTQVVTVNPIMMMEGFRSEPYMNMLRNAEMVIPDGTGVVWAARHFGTPVQERVAGFDLFQELMRRGKDLGWKVYLLGSSPEVVQATAENLQSMYPGIQIVGVQDGFFTGEDDQLVVADINEKQPDILLVARSMALQDPWIEYYKKQLHVSVMMGVGGSFDVISGKSKRAPQIFIKFHAEWLYRLLKEPWRAKRMLALPQFVLKVLSTRK
jgi:polysaccharide pyruvyl transferase CsaB